MPRWQYSFIIKCNCLDDKYSFFMKCNCLDDKYSFLLKCNCRDDKYNFLIKCNCLDDKYEVFVHVLSPDWLYKRIVSLHELTSRILIQNSQRLQRAHVLLAEKIQINFCEQKLFLNCRLFGDIKLMNTIFLFMFWFITQPF